MKKKFGIFLFIIYFMHIQSGKIRNLQKNLLFQNLEAENMKILDIVILIQEGNIPADVRVLNTTYNTLEVNGRNVTRYETTYEEGNEEKGAKHRVRIILDPYPEARISVTDWWIDSSNWSGDIKISRYTHYRLRGNGKKYKILNKSSASSLIIKSLPKKVVL